MDDDTLVCPCCGRARNIARETPLLQAGTAVHVWWSASPLWPVDAARRDRLQWACWPCLESGAALAADPGRQRYCDDPPYLAYFDQIRKCAGCGQDFVFRATEQRYWYEELRFWVMSTAKRCLACRRRSRAEGALMRQIQTARAQLDPTNVAQLLTLADLYRQIGGPRRAVEYLARARKCVGTPEERAAVEAIAALLAARTADSPAAPG